jgi:hypothetical protein
MKILPFFAFLFLFAFADAQTDTSFAFSRKGVEEEFHLKKYQKASQIKKYPIYGIEKSEVNDLQKLLTFFVAGEAELKLLRENNQQMSSLYESKVAAYESNQKIQEARIQNYDSAYNEMKKINGQLNDQLKNCEVLAIKENKRNKRPSLLGILGGLVVGVVVGVLIE